MMTQNTLKDSIKSAAFHADCFEVWLRRFHPELVTPKRFEHAKRLMIQFKNTHCEMLDQMAKLVDRIEALEKRLDDG